MRYLYENIQSSVIKRFVLLCGPRQVGKTSLAKHWLKKHSSGVYLNWDIDIDRENLLNKQFVKTPPSRFMVLDEIHKNHRWKAWLKGLYDQHPKELEVIVTGSARLDVYQRGGDSLLGRYDLLRLHPFSIGELENSGRINKPPKDWLEIGGNKSSSKDLWKQLETYSGFPEPFFEQSIEEYTKWSSRRRSLLIREDLRDLSAIRAVSLVEQLAILLPECVGSPLSVNSLRESLSVAHDTVSSWIEMLEKLYFCYRLPPFHKKISRSLVKEKKLYLWDWGAVREEDVRFENMVASHLLKNIHLWNDLGFGEFELCYWRDTNKQEVDFVITNYRKPIVLIEAKLNDKTFNPALMRLNDYLGGNLPMIQLVAIPGLDQRGPKHRIISAANFFSELN